ncbi:MAG TPA: hypothetical protein VN914_04180 [Polyangia bacterium]|nr:hypothetical protein [Polyangia bacterium]
MKTLALALLYVPALAVAAPKPPETVSSQAFVSEVTRFLGTEMAAHVAAVGRLDTPPETVLGVPTKGDFTWGSFMRALADVAALTGQRTIAGRDVPELIGQLGVIEANLGGKTFAQLGGTLALKHYGANLEKNAVWQALPQSKRLRWRDLLDPGRFYDRQKKVVINLPENYFGVAARIATANLQFGLEADRVYVDDLLDRAARPFLDGALYTDDHQPTGRYDRYSQEYARFILDAATNAGRKDVVKAVEPALQAVMRTWWQLVSADGYGYPWGRTIGAISYMDSMEIVGFLAENPRFRPAPLRELAAVYLQAWRWLQHDYKPDRHLLDMFGFGRGNYSYMSPERQWQQTTSFLGKAADSVGRLKRALEAEKVTAFPARPTLPPVVHFEWFRKGERPCGAWLVRQGALRFALPMTTGPYSGVADYLPAPHGLPGFAVPVAEKVPALVPFLERDDGKVLLAGDCADEIHPDDAKKELRVLWRRHVTVGTEQKAGLVDPATAPVDAGLTSEVRWKIEGDTLVRSETITAAKATSLKKFSVLFPSTGGTSSTRFENGHRIDRFVGPESALEVSVEGSVPLEVTLEATGNSSLGRGARGGIPLLLRAQARNVVLKAGESLR